MGVEFAIVLVLCKAIDKLSLIYDILKLTLKKLRHQRPRNWLANGLTGPNRCMTFFLLHLKIEDSPMTKISKKGP